MSEFLEQRRNESNERLLELRSKLEGEESRCAGKACVYATGSFARSEANKFSDLDLFIVGLDLREKPEDKPKRALGNIDEILLKAELIRTVRAGGIPEFSGDGQYLVHRTDLDLIETIGKPEDDAINTFTARLLLLLESRPLLGEDVYGPVIERVIRAYYRDYDDHKASFTPVYLANDILRLWRTFCVNYEARTETTPALKKAKRKLKNYKLKHSRMLTCYSAILFLLATHEIDGAVSLEAAIEMVRMTPTERLEWLLRQRKFGHVSTEILKLLQNYETFLQSSGRTEDELVQDFMDEKKAKALTDGGREFGLSLFNVFTQLTTAESRFYRMLVV